MEEEKLLKRKHRARTDNNQEQLANACNKLGDLYYEQDHYESAIEEYKEARESLRSLGKPMAAAVASRRIGECYSSLGDYKEALRMMREYFDVSKREGDLVEEQRALASIGRIYFLLADSVKNHSDLTEFKRVLREAKQAFMLSLKVCEKITTVDRQEHDLMRSRLMHNFAMLYEWQGDVEKAVEHFEKAIAINIKSHLYTDAANCYSALANLYCKQNNTPMALKIFDRALDAAQHCPNDHKLLCDILSGKADAYFTASNFRLAKQTLEKALKISKSHFLYEEKYWLENNFKAAIKLCENEEKLQNTPENNYETLRELYDQMGDACAYIRNFKKAVVYYKKMLECCEALGYCGEKLRPVLISLSKTYIDDGMYDEALKYLQKEYEIYEDNAEEACNISLTIAKVLELKGASYDTIMNALQKARDFALAVSSSKLELKVMKYLLKIQEKSDHSGDANETKAKIELIEDEIESIVNDSSEDENAMETPDWMDEMSLSELLDEPAIENNTSSCPRPVRRSTQGIKIKRNEKGETQLQVACIAGNYQRVKQLIDLKHPVNVNDNSGWTPLHEVCNYGYVDLVELLLDNGANINDPGGDGCEGITPLHDACSNGHLRIVEILLDRGACRDARTNDNKTPYHFLMEWYSRNNKLSAEDEGLFVSLKNRLKEGIADLCSEENLGFQKTKRLSKESKPRNKCPEITINRNSDGDRRDNKRRWTVVTSGSSSSESSDEESNINDSGSEQEKCSDDDSKSARCVPAESNATLEYQNAIKALRKPLQEPSRKFEKTARSVFVGDDDTIDDWLIDDISDSNKPNKRRKIKSDGIKLIGTLRRDVMIGSEESSNQSSDEVQENVVAPFREAQSEVSKESVAHRPVKKKPQQSCLLDSGFTRLSSDKIASEINIGHTTSIENEASVHTVKIHIENTFLVVPLPSNEISGSITVDWLAKEAAKRFSRLEGREPVLVLLTKDGATLAAEDPVSVIYEDRELLAQATSWKYVSLLQRYNDVCSLKSLEVDIHIEDRLRVCDASGCLNLQNCGLCLDKLTPLIQSLQHAYSLRELVLSGNILTDEGIETFSAIKGLTALEVLDLSCNDISSAGFTSMLPFLLQCQTLKFLDLSFNDLEGKWFENICCLCRSLPSLSSLNLESCSLSGEECGSTTSTLDKSLHNLEMINISYNPLGVNSVNDFLCHLNPSRITHLNVGGNTVRDSSNHNKIVEFFQRSRPMNLISLDLSDCDICDKDLINILRCLNYAERFKTLLLCNNTDLSNLSLNLLPQMTNMPAVIDLCGCKKILTPPDADSLINSTFFSKLSSLTISCDKTDICSSKTSPWADVIKSEWQNVWGDRAQILSGPSGLLKLNIKESS